LIHSTQFNYLYNLHSKKKSSLFKIKFIRFCRERISPERYNQNKISSKYTFKDKAFIKKNTHI